MASVTAVADNTTGTVQITVNFPSPTGTPVHVFRVLPDGTEAEVIGSPVIMSNGWAVLYDNSAPMDTAITYRAFTDDGLVVFDNFNRNNVDTWNNATSGQTWTLVGGAAADFDVNGSKGTQTHPDTNVFRRSVINAGSPDSRFRATVDLSDGTITGANASAILQGRYLDTDNHYQVTMAISTSDTVTMQLFKRVAGVGSSISSFITIATSYATNEQFVIELETVGTLVRARAWPIATAVEPDWQLSTTDTSLTTGNNVALVSRRETGNTNANLVFLWDNMAAYTAASNSVSSGSVTITASPDGWLKSPTTPTLDIRIDNCEVHSPDCLNENQLVFFKALETEEYESASGIFPIVNAPRPIVVSQVRKDLTTTLIIVSRRLEDITAIRNLLSSGEILTLSLPTIYGWGIESFGLDWVAVGTDTSARIAIDMRKPYRLWTLPLVVVDPSVAYPTLGVGGNGVGVTGFTWGDLAASGQTWGVHAATGNTWLDTAQGDNY